MIGKGAITLGKEIDFIIENVSLEVIEYDNYIYLYSIVVNQNLRGCGYGTNALLKIINYAKKQDKPLLAFATNELGGDVSKLIKWYKRHGFYEECNKMNIHYNYNLRKD